MISAGVDQDSIYESPKGDSLRSAILKSIIEEHQIRDERIFKGAVPF